MKGSLKKGQRRPLTFLLRCDARAQYKERERERCATALERKEEEAEEAELKCRKGLNNKKMRFDV